MSQTLATARPSATRWAQFYALTKPRVVQLIAFCALIGMLLAEPGLPEPVRVVAALAGIWLVAAAAAVFNCLVEQHIDAKMARTAWRATARGELTRPQALLFAALLCAAGAVLLLWVNPLTLWLTPEPEPVAVSCRVQPAGGVSVSRCMTTAISMSPIAADAGMVWFCEVPVA